LPAVDQTIKTAGALHRRFFFAFFSAINQWQILAQILLINVGNLPRCNGPATK
jgi:hypothetical protein